MWENREVLVSDCESISAIFGGDRLKIRKIVIDISVVVVSQQDPPLFVQEPILYNGTYGHFYLAL